MFFDCMQALASGLSFYTFNTVISPVTLCWWVHYTSLGYLLGYSATYKWNNENEKCYSLLFVLLISVILNYTGEALFVYSDRFH